MPGSINPLCEDDPLITIYFQDDNLVLPDDAVKTLEHLVDRDIGVGYGFINVYTRDYRIAHKAATWLDSHEFWIEEIAEVA